MINELISRLFRSSRSSRWTIFIAVAVLILLSACNTVAIRKPKTVITHDPKAPLVKPGAQDRLVLSVPSAEPSWFAPTSKLATVTFRALATGTSMLPKVLRLDEVTKNGKKVIKKDIATLRDNKKNGDQLKGDGFYAGKAKIASPMKDGKPAEGEKYYQLNVEFAGKTVTSSVATVPITNLKLEPSDPGLLVGDPLRYANEVIVAARLNVSPGRISQIVGEVSKALKVKLAIAGFVPRLDLYLVRIEGNNNDELMSHAKNAIEAFSDYPEVEEASPNFEGQPAASYSPSDEYFPACTKNTDVPVCQYYLQWIGAGKAWNWLESQDCTKTGSDTVKVALIDTGIDDSHPDLRGQVSSTAQPGDAGKGHGTQVAGLIAAKHNNKGIAGVAPDTKLIDLPGNMFASADPDTIIEGAKIINISRWWSKFDALTALKRNICDAICNGQLVVAVAGNVPGPACKQDDTFPGKYNDGALKCNGDIVEACSDQSIDASTGMLTVGAIDIDRDFDNKPDTGTTGVIAANMGWLPCSNVQPWVDIYAPGEQVITTKKGGTWGAVGGTSFAASLVSGAAAVLWAAFPSLTAQKVEEYLRIRGQPLDLALDRQVHPLLRDKEKLDEILKYVGDPPARVLDLNAAVSTEPFPSECP